MNEVRLKLSPPWITYIHYLEALFDADPMIALNVDASVPAVTVSVGGNDGDKVAALLKLLPAEKKFGNVTLKVNVDGVPSNRAFRTNKELFEAAFAKNPVFAYCVAPAQEGYYYVDFTYVVFKNCVVQFFNDNLNDPHGVVSTLYQDIAAELFEEAECRKIGNVCFCTDIEVGKLGKPLGEWP